MARISASENLVIETKPNSWRLILNENFVEVAETNQVVAEAIVGQSLRYTEQFASSRRLPKNGELQTKYIERVVLGWSADDEKWHLGLMFSEKLAEARGSRWCEIVNWPDPEQTVFDDLAIEAGETLARILECPFNYVPATRTSVPAPIEPPPLPPLPIKIEHWNVKRGSQLDWLEFYRDKAWNQERVRLIAWYSLWAIVFVFLSVITLLGDIALPRPTFLPYMGLFSAVALLGIVGYQVYLLRYSTRKIVADPATKRVWGTWQLKPSWRLERQEIDSVYVSQVIRKRNNKTMLEFGEINLRMTNGQYHFLIKQEQPQEIHAEQLTDELDLIPLNQIQMRTPLQSVAVYLGEALDVPVWYDYRKR